MAARPFQRVVRFLHHVAGAAEADQFTDGQLLARFVGQGEQNALETLIQRHGSLVWGVCRRLLHQVPDAEDAFQATFLVLLRKAGTLDHRPSLASWLYGVAYRVALNALKARAVAARRQGQQPEVADMPQTESPDALHQQELHEALDAELRRLPEKYRAPLVLCFLEGKTNEQAAVELGWPAGTVKNRTLRARDILRGRLARHGVALATGLLGP